MRAEVFAGIGFLAPGGFAKTRIPHFAKIEKCVFPPIGLRPKPPFALSPPVGLGATWCPAVGAHCCGDSIFIHRLVVRHMGDVRSGVTKRFLSGGATGTQTLKYARGIGKQAGSKTKTTKNIEYPPKIEDFARS